MAIEVFNRYEKKYKVPVDIYPKLMEELTKKMDVDKYCIGGNFYTICNIYFDTDTDALIRRSIEGPVYKEKLRMRSYGVPARKDFVFLEIKKKYNKIVNKRRTLLTLDEADKFMEKGELPTSGKHINKQVIKELNYFVDYYKPVPKLFLAYDRMALFEKGNGDVRITFDKNIRCRRDRLNLKLGDDGHPILEKDCYLMEIKVPAAFPLWITELISKYNIRNISFSKYGTEYKQYISKEA